MLSLARGNAHIAPQGICSRDIEECVRVVSRGRRARHTALNANLCCVCTVSRRLRKNGSPLSKHTHIDRSAAAAGSST